MSETAPLDRARREMEALAAILRLAASDEDYAEIARLGLERVETVVSAPVICLSMQEIEGIGHYVRIGCDVKADWAEEAGRAIARAHEHRLQGTPARPEGGPAPWLLTFLARTRSGRAGALALGAPTPLRLSRDEEQLMQRLAEHVVLVLDHALLLEQLERRETVDRLTGVPNQRRLLDILAEEIRRHHYTGRCLSLLVVDVEGLDGINRTYGRTYGSHILRRLAGLIREAIRPIDTITRCGLDEFAVVLPEAGETEAQRVLETLRERLLAVEFAGGDVGVTLALAQIEPEESLTPEAFLLRAEAALAQTKQQQRAWRSHVPLSGAGLSSPTVLRRAGDIVV